MKSIYAVRSLFIAVCAVILTGCAHRITLTGDTAALVASPQSTQSRIDKSVGLVIPDALRTKEFVTPGGGGDKVSYMPYRDLELPLYVGLGHAFSSVTKFDSVPDSATVQAKNLSCIVTPAISTTSSSGSLVTWPPTDFSVTLACTITDPTGKLVATKEVTGNGHAEFSEFKRNFGLAAQRATLDAVQKLQAAMLESTELRH